MRAEKKVRMVCSFVVAREKEHKSSEPHTYLLKGIKGSTDLFYLTSNLNFNKFIQNLWYIMPFYKMLKFSICTPAIPFSLSIFISYKEKFQVSTKTLKNWLMLNLTSKTNSKGISSVFKFVVYALILKWRVAHNSFSMPEIIFFLRFRREEKKKEYLGIQYFALVRVNINIVGKT